MGKPKRQKTARLKDLVAKKDRDVRGGKSTDETLADKKDKTSGETWGLGLGKGS